MCDEREGGEKERGDICSCKTLYEVLEPKSDVRHHINNGRNRKNPARIRPTVKICLSTFGHDAKIFSLSFLAGGGDIVSCTHMHTKQPARPAGGEVGTYVRVYVRVYVETEARGTACMRARRART